MVLPGYLDSWSGGIRSLSAQRKGDPVSTSMVRVCFPKVTGADHWKPLGPAGNDVRGMEAVVSWSIDCLRCALSELES